MLNSHSDPDSEPDLVTGKRFAVQAKWESYILEGFPYFFPLPPCPLGFALLFPCVKVKHPEKKANHFFPTGKLPNIERLCRHISSVLPIEKKNLLKKLGENFLHSTKCQLKGGSQRSFPLPVDPLSCRCGLMNNLNNWTRHAEEFVSLPDLAWHRSSSRSACLPAALIDWWNF